MQLRILKSGFEDLDRGRAFYAHHADELGDYFLDSLFADIDSLALYAEIHMQFWATTECSRSAFPSRPTTGSRAMCAQCGAYSIVAGSRADYGGTSVAEGETRLAVRT